jgi:hypothetical protein
MAQPGKMDFAEASGIMARLMAAWESSPPPPAHKVTRANDFNDLSALLRDSSRFKPRELHFAPRNETFRTRGLKSLESLRTANQPFRGFVSYQWLEADFVSLLSAHGAHRACRHEAAKMCCARLCSSFQGWTGSATAASMEFLSRNHQYSTFSVNQNSLVEISGAIAEYVKPGHDTDRTGLAKPAGRRSRMTLGRPPRGASRSEGRRGRVRPHSTAW